MLGFVGICSDNFDLDLFVSAEVNKPTVDADDMNNEKPSFDTIYAQLTWWKGGMNEYEVLGNVIMSAPTLSTTKPESNIVPGTTTKPTTTPTTPPTTPPTTTPPTTTPPTTTPTTPSTPPTTTTVTTTPNTTITTTVTTAENVTTTITTTVVTTKTEFSTTISTTVTTQQTSVLSSATTVTTFVSIDYTDEATGETYSWTEEAVSKQFYAQYMCNKRAGAFAQATSLGHLFRNDKVNVIAYTNTGYYKLEDGTYVHSDYLGDTPVIETLPGTSTGTLPDGNSPAGSYQTQDLSKIFIEIYDLTSKKYVTDNAFNILCQIVYNETGGAFHKEAMKAQAVAAYSFMKFYLDRGDVPEVGLKPNPPQEIIDAVKEVEGLGVYYNNKIALTVYHASSAGTTIDSKSIFGTNYPYLKAVESIYDKYDKNWDVKKVYSAETLRQVIENNTNITLSDDKENWFTVASTFDGTSYVNKVLVDGHSSCYMASSGKVKAINGRAFRIEVLGTQYLRSTSFTVEYNEADDTFTFTTRGYGHGVGMSQWGAHLYATNEGWTFDQILMHYYTGVTIR